MNEVRPRIAFVGVLPPPVNGMTLATTRMLEALGRRQAVEVYGMSQLAGTSRRRWKVRKAFRSLLAIPRIVRWRMRGVRTLYFVANSGPALSVDVLYALVARLCGLRVILHHQVYSYLHERDGRMAMVDSLMGSRGTHVVLCDEMAARFRRLYRGRARMLVVPNVFPAPGDLPERTAAGRFRIGHLSNLTVEKGFDVVLATFAALRDDGHDVELCLAGPLMTARERALLDDYSARYGTAIVHLGPVYDREKWKFFRSIDTLLFPTRYRNEAFPLAVAEAVDLGIPVIAFGRACIPSLLGNGGVLVPPEQDFVASASKILASWIDDPKLHEEARRAASGRGRELRLEVESNIRQFVETAEG